jgi:glycosyltransferase involved in cell wall biosynthesis
VNTNLQVQHVSLLNTGGAFVAASRISKAISDQGVLSELKTLMPEKKNIIQKIGSKTDYLLQRANPSGHTVSHFRTLGVKPISRENMNLDCDSQKIVNLHWVAGMNIERILNQSLSLNWFWTAHDENVMTGYCHITGTCKKFEADCTFCPQAPSILKGRVKQSFHSRSQFFDENMSRLTLISPSNWMRDRLAKAKSTSKLNLVTIRNPVPLEIFKPLHGVKDSKVISVGYLGSNYAKSKNSAAAFDVLKAFLQTSPDLNFKLVCIGEKFELDPNSEITVQIKPGSPEGVIARQFRELDILLYTSEADNLPNLLVEAQASGVVVVALDFGGIKETFSDGASGILCRDLRDLSNALEALSNSASKLDSFSRNARKYAEENFDPSSIGKHYINLYQRK